MTGWLRLRFWQATAEGQNAGQFYRSCALLLLSPFYRFCDLREDKRLNSAGPQPSGMREQAQWKHSRQSSLINTVEAVCLDLRKNYLSPLFVIHIIHLSHRTCFPILIYNVYFHLKMFFHQSKHTRSEIKFEHYSNVLACLRAVNFSFLSCSILMSCTVILSKQNL